MPGWWWDTLGLVMGVGLGILLITCPATGKEFSTGLNVAKDALKSLPRNQETIAFSP
jgi:hypothetical protein